MSRETHQWLSENVLVGFTEKRGTAWHYREGDDNHYVGAVPVEDVLTRLFNWQPLEVPEQWTFDGKLVTGKDKVILRSDTGAKMGTFTQGYRPHPYPEWLVDNVGTLLDDDLAIGSAGLLSGGAVAFVSVEVPENITTPEGVEFRPNLLAATSFNGSLATTYKRVNTVIVCDNTLDTGLGEKGQQIKRRHSSKSLDGKVQAARDALEIVYATADDFAAEVARLSAVKVSDQVWDDIVKHLTTPDEDASKRSVTMATNKAEALHTLWTSDDRVTPWHGTAFGAVQALNTYAHHVQTVKGAERAERNLLNAVKGVTGQADRENVELVLSLAK